MQPQQLLSQLKDIHAPEPISMWPATFAWYFLFSLLLAFLIYVAIKITKVYAKKRRQQKVLKLLTQAVDLYQMDPAAALANISILLRRVALAKYKRIEVANLNNNAWLIFLDNAINTTEFTHCIGQVLLTAPYQKSAEVDITQLAALVRRWIVAVL